jgi:hypothetical protein
MWRRNADLRAVQFVASTEYKPSFSNGTSYTNHFFGVGGGGEHAASKQKPYLYTKLVF